MATARSTLATGRGGLRNTLCPCGSGKRFKHCCGALTAQSSGADDLAAAGELFAKARAAFDAGEPDRADELAAAILERVPGQLGALRLRIAIRRQRKDHKGAAALIGRLLRLFPRAAEARLDAAALHEERGRFQHAERELSAALEFAPGDFEVQAAMGRLMQRLGQFGRAEYHLRQASYLRPDSAEIAGRLAVVLSALGRFDEAEREFRIDLSLAPDDFQSLLEWARMEEFRNRPDRAWGLLLRAKRLQPASPWLPVAEAGLHRRGGYLREALDSLNRVDRQRLDDWGQTRFYFERGLVLDGVRRYAAAWSAFTRANTLCRQKFGMRYHATSQRAFARRLTTLFGAQRVAALPAPEAGEDDFAPVFVVGYPGSGQDAIESLLASHPDICAAGEFHGLAWLCANAGRVLADRRPYPECLDREPAALAAAARALRGEYQAALRASGALLPGARFVVDRMPFNELHLGVVRLAFPEAAVIHAVRHPLDAVLAAYFTDTRHGGHCSYDLAAAAAHYALAMELVRHYRNELRPHYLGVRCEDLRADPIATRRKMLEFIGLADAGAPGALPAADGFNHRNYFENVRAVRGVLEPWMKSFAYRAES